MRRRNAAAGLLAGVVALGLAGGAQAAAPRSATPAAVDEWTAVALQPPSASPWPEALRQVARAGFEIRHARDARIRLWPVRTGPEVGPPTAPAERVAYPDLADGALVALAELIRPWTDFRGQPIAPGRYLLRYARQPLLPDHEGTAPWRDFLLLAPLEATARPVPVPLAGLLAGSRRASGTSHPAVLALLPVADGVASAAGGLVRGPAGERVVVVTALGRPRALVLAAGP